MSILRYNDYISEKVVYELLLESKVVYSKKFINLLNKMKDNDIAKKLISMYSTDVNIQHNYVDVGSEKDVVTFTPDRKVQEMEKDKEDIYVVTDSGRYLTHATGNDQIYKLLEYEKPSDGAWDPSVGTRGIILKEIVSPRSGKIFAWFKGIQEYEGKETVINKEALETESESDNYKIWTMSRNNIKIGRLVRSILTATKASFTDKDIENFVNQYKAIYDLMSNALARFEIVKGKDIAYWYDEDKYSSKSGVLGSSCMAGVDSDYFDIYVNNPDVCRLIILFDEDGSISKNTDSSGQLELFPSAENMKYRSNKISGRCLLWKTDKGEIMDRIYTTNDSDVELFKQFGQKSGFWWKKNQDSDTFFTAEDGTSSVKQSSYIIKLDSYDFDYYPYLDTFCYLNEDKGILTNDHDSSYDKMLRDTEGGWDEN